MQKGREAAYPRKESLAHHKINSAIYEWNFA